MPRRRIFVSHSTKGPNGLALLTAVAAQLEGPQGYELRLDRQNLVPGVDWYREVSDYMMDCEGAVLLWDANAADSDYVQHEASVLSHRWKTEEPNFKLFVALIDDCPPAQRLKRTDLSQGRLRATRIADTHIWSAPDDLRGHPQALAAALAAAAVQTLGDGSYRLTRRDRIIDGLREQLEAYLTAESLRSAIEDVDQPDLNQVVERLPPYHLFRAAAGWMADRAASDLRPVRELVEAFRANLKGGHGEILRFLRIADADWLSEGRDSCPIGAAVIQAGQGAAAAVNGAKTPVYTLSRLALRALRPGEQYRIVACHGKALDEEEVAAEIHAKMSPLLGEDADEATLNAFLEGERTLCLLAKGYPRSPADRRLIDDLRARFPNVVFVAWPAEAALEPWAASGSQAGAAIQPINPVIDLIRELDRFTRWRGLKGLLDGQ